jgi:FtsH-binding integral membrane protein
MRYDNSYSLTGAVPPGALQDSTRTFMNRVYAWMAGGLFLTGGVAWAVASNETLFSTLAPYFRILAFAQLGVVLAFVFLQQRVSGAVAAAMFLAYAALTGVTFSVLFYVYSLGSIAGVFAITASSFLALSIFATVTKRDLSGWATFLFIGLIGIVIAGIVNLFVHSGVMGFVIACASVLVFAGLTAYDTQKLRQIHAASGYSNSATLPISGALTLYLDFINLFLALLRLFGNRRN